ncbi:uncharacterized protein ASPGLDRAFT_1010864 [Aspergillus glaucus CBS 516.65]|uniref:Uncharacterized protein n=1 Tax=Aspergillus glaucus CBS 516.65 TaxID=1160497 RepID=A0A1L9VVM8_ASPGL|nr:hypothetical protein ASPGLDRAFT_1010864 [Aspergillus glaucus CBS 516.65]OJJ87960.1 hypothetical protein ASPGLDRAFT_1010864 [Aspergillus glaucus CBS 516.65]
MDLHGAAPWPATVQEMVNLLLAKHDILSLPLTSHNDMTMSAQKQRIQGSSRSSLTVFFVQSKRMVSFRRISITLMRQALQWASQQLLRLLLDLNTMVSAHFYNLEIVSGLQPLKQLMPLGGCFHQ